MELSNTEESDVDEVTNRCEADENDHGEEMGRTEQIKTAASFFGVGLLLHCLFALVVSGSQDILSGTLIPTSTILVSHEVPMVLVMTLLPWCMQRISYLFRTLAVAIFMASGIFLVIFVDNVFVKIVGVALNAVAHGLGEVSFLALATFYDETAITAFAAGSGAGILLGPLYYTGLTIWACVSPFQTLVSVSPAPLIILICYYCLNKDRIKPYAFLNADQNCRYRQIEDSSQPPEHAQLSWREKLAAALQITPLMLALLVTYVAQYVTVHAIFTTLAFADAPFPPRDHFVYYVLMNGIGEFLARSYLNVTLFVKPSLVPTLIIKRAWLLAIPLCGIMGFAICASYYRFLGDVSVVMVTCFFVGALSGAVFANTICAVPLIVEPRYHEFSLGLITAGEAGGALLASLVGLQVEPALRRHCQHVTSSALCFTRESQVAWSTALCRR